MAGRKRFDVEAALECAMTVFWERGFDGTSVDDLTAATGLGRSSLYATYGDKETLFLACLDRYAGHYGDRYDAALAGASRAPLDAVTAFYDVTLGRIADPGLPDGCLAAQTVMAAPSLPPGVADRATGILGAQRRRLAEALAASGIAPADRDGLALHLAAVNQSLAVLSRGGVAVTELRAVVAVALIPLRRALDDARSGSGPTRPARGG